MGNAMTDQKRALGKGLGSLIPMSGNKQDVPQSGQQRVYFECLIDDIIPNPNQPRKLFHKEALDELSASIKETGIIQPLIVRPIGGGKYELIAGERRFRAAKQAGLVRVPVVVKDADESSILKLALIENIQRQDLNPIEEALAYKELLSRHQLTQDELAKQVGKDRSSLANSLRLLKLPDKIRDYVINNRISMGHARALLTIENRELQIQVADDVINNNLSVREVELLTKRLKEHEVEEMTTATHSAASRASNPAKDYSVLVKQLENHLRNKVQIKSNGDKGQIAISFNNEAELGQIMNKLLS